MPKIESRYRLNSIWSTSQIDLLHSGNQIQQKQELKKREKNEKAANFSSHHSSIDFFAIRSVDYDSFGVGVSKTT